jgi:methionine sulfoxide reductase heme-binding subunit
MTLALLLLHPLLPARVAATDPHADPTFWYLTRAAAMTAYVLLVVTVDIGILRSIAGALRVRASWALDELHQFVALLAAAFVALHLLFLLLDPFLTFTLANLLLPLDQPFKQIPVDIGVLAFYALAIVLVSSWLRRSISYSTWRGLHYVSFVLFALVTLHGLFAGSDSGLPWTHALYIGSASSVVFLTVMRLLTRGASASAPSSTR